MKKNNRQIPCIGGTPPNPPDAALAFLLNRRMAYYARRLAISSIAAWLITLAAKLFSQTPNGFNWGHPKPLVRARRWDWGGPRPHYTLAVPFQNLYLIDTFLRNGKERVYLK